MIKTLGIRLPATLVGIGWLLEVSVKRTLFSASIKTLGNAWKGLNHVH